MKRKVFFWVIILFLITSLLWAVLELSGDKTGPKPTNFKQIKIVLLSLIFLVLAVNFIFHVLSKISFPAEQLITMFQTKTCLFQGQTFQLIGQKGISFSHWKAKGSLILQDEREKNLDVSFVCYASNSRLDYLRSLLKNVKTCPSTKLNWWDWLTVFIMLFVVLFVLFGVVILASF